MSSESGYARIEDAATSGFTSPRPSYFSVCNGDGNTEAVRITYDPSQISYDQILEWFGETHDPTRQYGEMGEDKARQYASAIWPTTPEQQQIATAVVVSARERANRSNRRQPLTVVSGASQFWPAEQYHQNYWAKFRGKLGVGALLVVALSSGNEAVMECTRVVFPLFLIVLLLEYGEMVVTAFPKI